MDKETKIFLIEKTKSLLYENVKNLEKSLTGINDSINDAPGAMESHSDTTRSQLTSVMNTAHKSFNEKKKELESFEKFPSDLIKTRYEEVSIGVIIVLKKENDTVENYFLLPGGSGIKLEHNGDKFTCLSFASPLGKALIGKKKNEIFLLNIGSMSQKVKILDLV